MEQNTNNTEETTTVEVEIDTDKTKRIVKMVGIGALVGTLAYLLKGQSELRQVSENQQDTIDTILERTDPEPVIEEPEELTD